MIFSKKKKIKPVVLCVLDGWGYAANWGGNAIAEAETPNFDHLWRHYPHRTLLASGESVGLPGHEMGNSEVGHLNLGAGRIVRQDILRLNKAIKSGNFFRNPVLKKAVEYAQKKKSKIHLMGLVSDGGVHSHLDHLFALLDFLKKEKIKNNVYIQAFTDGRDTDPMSGLQYLNRLIKKTREVGLGKIATICGRYWAMDRDKRLDRTSSAYENMIAGSKSHLFDSPLKAMSRYYAKGITDEYIPPTLIDRNGLLSDGDVIIFFNFRADRARQITTFIVDRNFRGYRRSKILNEIFFVSMIPYYEQEMGLEIPIHSAFKPEIIKNTLAEIISKANLKQFHIAETEKYAHVTYFFNGAREEPFAGEDRVIIPSPKVPIYDKTPAMSAAKIADQLVSALRKDIYSFLLVNFANPDMVGHTGNLKATISACEKVDQSLGKIWQEIRRDNGTLLLVADHGNAEEMLNLITGESQTEHTNNPVPFIVADKIKGLKNDPQASLSSVAPTICDIMNLEKPKEMTGKSLILKNGKDAYRDHDVIEYKV